MKKFTVFVLAALLIVAPTAALAQTATAPASPWRLFLEALGLGSIQPAQVSRSTLLESLGGQTVKEVGTAECEPGQQAAGGLDSQPCMPSGQVNQTLRHDGTRWVADSNLLNFGNRLFFEGNVAIGGASGSAHKLVVMGSSGQSAIWAESPGDNAIAAVSHGGTGVFGLNTSAVGGAGVQGSTNSSSGAAVSAANYGTGYGFYQSGPNAKNYFEGKVGVGISDPTEKLDVSGKVKATGFCLGADCLTSWPSGGGSVWEQITGTQNIRNTNTGNVGIGTAAGVSPAEKLQVTGGYILVDGTSFPNYKFKSTQAGAKQFQIHADSPQLVFRNNDDSKNPALFNMTAPANSLILDADGDLGVGVTAPGARLEVSRSVASALARFAQTNWGSILDIAGLSSGDIALTSGSTGNKSVLFNPNGSGGLLIGSNTGGVSLGVGVPIPSAQLHTSGTVRFAGVAGVSENTTNTRIITSDSSGNVTWRNPGSWTGSGGSVWEQITGTQNIRNTNTGSVGIGVTDPQAKLDVLGTVQSTLVKTDILQSKTNDGLFILDYAGNTIASVGEQPLGFKVDGDTMLYDVSISGKAGIGITNPQYPLSLGGGSGTNNKKLAVYESGADFYGFGIESNHLTIWAGNDKAMSLRDGGNVGIGVTDPQTKLDVAGGLKLRSSVLPPCNETYRGTFIFVAGGPGQDDQLYFCMKRAGGFNWLGG